MRRNLLIFERTTIDLDWQRGHSACEHAMLSKVSILAVTVVLLAASSRVFAQQAETSEAFGKYVAQAEARIAQERNSAFLRLETLPAPARAEMTARLRRGEVVIESQVNTPDQIPGGLIHDWLGVAFIPHANLQQVMGLVRDYNHLAAHYSPDVIESRLVSAKGDDLHVYMRLWKHKVVTVVLDTEYDVHYGRIDAGHQYSISRSTRVSEIENPGGPTEHALAEGHDHGFMWRLNTYWNFEQAEDGVFIQCEAISLTRDIPTGLGWLIGPFVNSIPRESLQFTLNATRNAFAGDTGHKQAGLGIAGVN